MRPAGSPAKAKQSGALRPASEGMNGRLPTVEEFDRWYSHLRTLRRVVPKARLRRDAQTSGLLGFAGLPAGRIRGLGTSQSLVPLV